MKLTRFLASLPLLAMTVLPGSALELLPSFADIATDTEMSSAFDQMAKGHELPDWVFDGVVGSSGRMVSFDGKFYLALSGCQQHNCGASAMAVLYNSDDKVMYGVIATQLSDDQERLEWLNIGGGAESIDGRTLLYAALTGSLSNHPQEFYLDPPTGGQ